MAPQIHANQPGVVCVCVGGGTGVPVSVTMKSIQSCYFQCGSSPQVIQTKPGLLLCVCVCMFECREPERDNECEFMRPGVKTDGEHKGGSSSRTGQCYTFILVLRSIADRTDKLTR